MRFSTAASLLLLLLSCACGRSHPKDSAEDRLTIGSMVGAYGEAIFEIRAGTIESRPGAPLLISAVNRLPGEERAYTYIIAIDGIRRGAKGTSKKSGEVREGSNTTSTRLRYALDEHELRVEFDVTFGDLSSGEDHDVRLAIGYNGEPTPVDPSLGRVFVLDLDAAEPTLQQHAVDLPANPAEDADPFDLLPVLAPLLEG